MKNTYKYIKALPALITLLVVAVSCIDDPARDGNRNEDGAPLKIRVHLEAEDAQTRLGPITNLDQISEDGELRNLGMYIYYSDDYSKGDLSKPYVRNKECEIRNGELVILDGEELYIYDRMTIELFYPYNAEMSKEENYFKTNTDKHNYYITKWNYAEQKFFPYYASATTYPNQSHFVEIALKPKHVYKIEIVLVADNESELPYYDTPVTDEFKKSGIVKLLPNKDPYLEDAGDRGTDQETGLKDGVRDFWFFNRNYQPDDGTGVAVHQYEAYFWTGRADDENAGNVNWNADTGMDKNTILKGEVLMQCENGFTLIASQDILVWTHQKNASGSFVYRYGYNVSTGEVFIPTSTSLINSQTRLENMNTFQTNHYQVCDIRLNKEWQPKNLLQVRYDGGGKAIYGLNINETPESGNVGLFGSIFDSSVCNLDIIDPSINITGANINAGAICGSLNRSLTFEEAKRLLNFPDKMPAVVIKALIEDAISELYNSTSYIYSSRVVNPAINVEATFQTYGDKKLQSVYVGGLVGSVGAYDENNNLFNGRVENSYVLGGGITVTGITDDNSSAEAGGFAGIIYGTVQNSYTTMKDENVSAWYNYSYYIQNKDYNSGIAEHPITNPKFLLLGDYRNKARSFGSLSGVRCLVDDCFAMADNDNADDYKMNDGYGNEELPEKKFDDENDYPAFDADRQKAGITAFVNGWPAWPTVNGANRWPNVGAAFNPGWYSMGNKASELYPILQWERK